MRLRQCRLRSTIFMEGSEASKKRASIPWRANVTSQATRPWYYLLSDCDSAQEPITERISCTRGSEGKTRAETRSRCIALHPKVRSRFASGRDTELRAPPPDGQFHRQPSAREAPRLSVMTCWRPVRGHDSRACSSSHLHPSRRLCSGLTGANPLPYGFRLSSDPCRRRSVHTTLTTSRRCN